MQQLLIKWFNPTNGRFYRIYLIQDLAGGLIVRFDYGGTRSNHRRIKDEQVFSLQEVDERIAAQQVTRARRGYEIDLS